MTQELKNFYFELFLYILQNLFMSCEDFDKFRNLETKWWKLYDKIIYIAINILDIIVNEKLIYEKWKKRISQKNIIEILQCNKGEVKKLFLWCLSSRISYNENKLKGNEQRLKDTYTFKLPLKKSFSKSIKRLNEEDISFIVDSHYNVIEYSVFNYKDIYYDYIKWYFLRLCLNLLPTKGIFDIICKYDKEMLKYNKPPYLNTILQNNTFSFRWYDSILKLLYTNIEKTNIKKKEFIDHCGYDYNYNELIVELFNNFWIKFFEPFENIFKTYNANNHIADINIKVEVEKKRKKIYNWEQEISF